MKRTISIMLVLGMLGAMPAWAESITVENRSGKRIGAIVHADEILKRTRGYLLENGYKWANTDIGNLKIVIFETRGDLNIFLSENFRQLEGVVACYDTEHNVIYTFQRVTPHILAHEFTHVLVTHSGIKIAKGHLEDLPKDVDSNVNLSWIW